MPCMEIRSSFTSCFFLFLFLILAHPSFSSGRREVLDSEMYEIDYRGPETHSSLPPPHHLTPATNSLVSPPRQEKVKKIRG